MAPYAKTEYGRGWVQNVATAFYAVASASGAFFFALNFGSEGKRSSNGSHPPTYANISSRQRTSSNLVLPRLRNPRLSTNLRCRPLVLGLPTHRPHIERCPPI